MTTFDDLRKMADADPPITVTLLGSERGALLAVLTMRIAAGAPDEVVDILDDIIEKVRYT